MVRNVVLYGDCLAKLRKLPDRCVQTCVTSPPYFGLRDYGTRRWFGGDPACEHDQAIEHGPHHPGQVEQTKWKTAKTAGKGQTATTSTCSKCGAWYGQLGLERAPTEYVEHIVEIFREVKRVLRDDGTLWLNLGDSYAGSGKGSGGKNAYAHDLNEDGAFVPAGMKPKDLMLIPTDVARALRSDGWYLRADIVWFKLNCMPESVTDRPSRVHEMVFLLSKSSRYFYDADAVREPFAESTLRGKPTRVRVNGQQAIDGTPGRSRMGGLINVRPHSGGRNCRSVWSIPPSRVGGHSAAMPFELAARCIMAASKKGDLVLDPFAGSGTTLMAAKHRERNYIGIEINEGYRPLIEQRLGLATQRQAELDAVRRMVTLMRTGT